MNDLCELLQMHACSIYEADATGSPAPFQEVHPWGALSFGLVIVGFDEGIELELRPVASNVDSIEYQIRHREGRSSAVGMPTNLSRYVGLALQGVRAARSGVSAKSPEVSMWAITLEFDEGAQLSVCLGDVGLDPAIPEYLPDSLLLIGDPRIASDYRVGGTSCLGIRICGFPSSESDE